MLTRRRFLLALVGQTILGWAKNLFAQTGVFLTEQEAPEAVFPEATAFERQVIKATPELREKMQALMGKFKPSIWEDAYTTFLAKKGGEFLGYAVIVEEIGKHRPITFVVGIQPDHKVHDVAIMVFREPYGGQVKERIFLKQYRGKSVTESFLPFQSVRSVAGATLSIHALARGIKKAAALVQAVYQEGKEGGW
ncbi:MAG: FMN-binding protein [candidate division NC10 bacterium]|nr:FMN-binding protein [candidate division NC10 bacterium]